MMTRGMQSGKELPHMVHKIGINAYLPLPFEGWQTRMQIASYWDQAAPGYARYQRQFLEREKERAVIMWKLLFHDLIGTHTRTVLDAGCGPGLFSALLCEIGHQVTGVDLSHPMLSEARKLAYERNVSPILKRSDLEFLPFDDASFDLVFCCDVLWSVLHPQRVVHEFRRVLRPGGSLILIDRVPRFPGIQYFNKDLMISAKILTYIESLFNPGGIQPEKDDIYSFMSSLQHQSSDGLKLLEDVGFTQITHNTSVQVPSFGYGSWLADIFSRNVLITGLNP